jgi:hypothetical protein
MADITIQRQLAVINGFVETPDDEPDPAIHHTRKSLRNKLRPADVLALISGSTQQRLGIMVRDQQWILLPEEDQFAGPAQDFFQDMRDTAATV